MSARREMTAGHAAPRSSSLTMHHHHMSLRQVAAVLTTTGHIAAVTYLLTLAHAGYYSLYFTMGSQMTPQNPSSTGGSRHHLVHSFLAHLSKCHKWHLHQFIYFCRAHGCDQQTCTERHTQKPQNTGNNRLHCMLCTAIWPSNIKFFDIPPSNSSWHSYPSWLMHIKHIFCHCYQCAININAKMFTTIHLSAHP